MIDINKKNFIKKTWPLWGIAIFTTWAVISWFTVVTPEQDVYPTVETNCQEGWIKYELSTGILCSKYVLNEEQIAEYEK